MRDLISESREEGHTPNCRKIPSICMDWGRRSREGSFFGGALHGPSVSASMGFTAYDYQLFKAGLGSGHTYLSMQT